MKAISAFDVGASSGLPLNFCRKSRPASRERVRGGRQEINIHQSWLHFGSFASSLAACEAGITAASGRTGNTGSPPRRVRPRLSLFNARRTKSDSTCPIEGIFTRDSKLTTKSQKLKESPRRSSCSFAALRLRGDGFVCFETRIRASSIVPSSVFS